jgi:polyhydroxyalkanoate synthase
MSKQTENMGMNLPNPADMAKTYAEVAQRASRLINQFMEKKVKEGVSARPMNLASPRLSWICRRA